MAGESNLLSDYITWEFTAQIGGIVSRFGRLGERYYKQLLPFGKEDAARHPPREISKRMYDLAKYDLFRTGR